MKLLLLDGHSLAYRAFFALPTDLVTSSGTVTNAAYGFTSMLAKVVADEKPDALAVAFDAPGGSTERYALDPEYKAGRSAAPDLFRAQLPLINEVIDALQIRRLSIPDVEADDVIATLATLAADNGVDVVIVTGDRDAFQLVRDPHIKVLYNKRGVSDYARYDEAGIVERTGGVTPRQYIDYAALRGDSSDNLPGVPGIGEKTAAKLITTYDNLEGIYEHLDALPPKQRENLGAAHDRVFMNRVMSTLRTDVDCDVTLDELTLRPFDREVVRVLFNQLEFRTVLPRVLDAFGETADAPEATTFEVETTVARDAAAAAAVLAVVAEHMSEEGNLVAIEPSSADPARHVLRGVALSWTSEPPGARADASGGGRAEAHYIAADLLEEIEVAAELERIVSGPPKLLAHRSKELMHGLDGVILPLAHDTALMAYLLDPGEGKYLLEDLALRYLGMELRSPDVEEGRLDFGGDEVPARAGRNAAAVLQLAGTLEAAIVARELVDLYQRFELPLVPVLMTMERVGVRIDVAFLGELGKELSDQARQHEAQIHAYAGEPFAVNSVPQLRMVLFEKLGLTPVKKTKTGASTDADSLQKMAEEHPIIEEILRYREVEKLRGTYADALPPLVAADGRIHANFNQLVASTGRISSENPNLQNIPVRSASGREMRKAFIADDGCVLLTADYSQIELRVLAHVAEDPGLIDAFERGVDVHTVTASKVFGVGEADVDEFQRRFAKVVNYGLAYGMEAYGLGQRLDIPTDQAREILDNYFAGFPRVAEYMRGTVAEAKARGYTTTMFGRRRQLPELSSDNFRIRQMGERMAQNAPVQGAAADIFKLAMIACDAMLTERGLRTRMILTVHDELVFDVVKDELDEVSQRVKETMESVCELRVPLVVDLGSGPTWADCK